MAIKELKKFLFGEPSIDDAFDFHSVAMTAIIVFMLACVVFMLIQVGRHNPFAAIALGISSLASIMIVIFACASHQSTGADEDESETTESDKGP